MTISDLVVVASFSLQLTSSLGARQSNYELQQVMTVYVYVPGQEDSHLR